MIEFAAIHVIPTLLLDCRRPAFTRGESPRRGRGRGKRGGARPRDRGIDHGDLPEEDGWKKARMGQEAKKRNVSGKKESSRPGSRQLSDKGSRDASPKPTSEEIIEKEKDDKKEEKESVERAAEDGVNDEAGGEEKGLGEAEDFSDFGESDEEILNQVESYIYLSIKDQV